MPVPLPELVSLQVFLAGLEEPEISPIARDSLQQMDPQVAAGVIGDAPTEVIAFLAHNHPHPSVVEKVLQRRDVPRELLVELAPSLDEELQEILLLRQDAIVERPEILDALERNPQLSSFSARRIAEYRQHLLPADQARRRRAAPAAEAAEVVELDAAEEPVAGAAEEPEFEETAELADDLLATDGYSEVEIRTLPTPLRMQLSRGAPRNLRNILIRDSNPAVALSVLTNNAIPEGELEQIAANRAVLDEVLEAIARNPRWVRRYGIVRALVANPRTPVGLAVRLTARLAVRDLRALSRDRNVADAVRAPARRLYRIKLK